VGPVTRGSRRIGLAVVWQLTSEGARVVFTDRSILVVGGISVRNAL
jgi:NAD(P)-dependent dehydrogenase (short-subunit alcohol dehydrogenase family)